MTLPQYAYLDPALVLERKQERTCLGCAHLSAQHWLGVTKNVCDKSMQKSALNVYEMPRCRKYVESGKTTMKDFETFEQRLENWGRVVRSPRYQSGVCAVWARWFVSKRGSIEDDKSAPAASVPPIDKDGWLLEGAWRAMPDSLDKWALKYEYVWRMSPDQIRTRLQKVHRLNVRGKSWELVMAQAQAGMKKVLANFSEAATIRDRLLTPLTRDLTDAPWQAEASEDQED